MRKLKVNVGKSKVMRCSRFVLLNGEPFKVADCSKYQGSKVSADGGCGA